MLEPILLWPPFVGSSYSWLPILWSRYVALSYNSSYYNLIAKTTFVHICLSSEKQTIYPMINSRKGSWTVYHFYLLYYSQEKIQSEMDLCLKEGEQPTLDDRIAMPRLEAAIAEVQRIRTVTPLGIPHGTSEVPYRSQIKCHFLDGKFRLFRICR